MPLFAAVIGGAAVATSLLPSKTPRQADLPYGSLLLVMQSDHKSRKKNVKALDINSLNIQYNKY